LTEAADSGAPGLSRALPQLSRGLVAYGIVGLVVAAIGFGAMVWVNGRISSLRTDAEATVARAEATMELAAAVLRGASTTIQSFSGTADQARQAVSAAAVTITEVQSDLTALEAQLRSVSFLGATPLSSSADAVARIAASMDGLESQIPLIAGSLTGNRDALAANAASLSALADSTAALAARLDPGLGQNSLADLQQVIAITLLMFAAWSFVPAIGALGLGVWLRRELGRSRST
jgi:hypothetical protein